MTHTAAFDADALEDPAETGSSGWLREMTVHISMMVVIAALGMALRTSFGFGMIPAIVVALTVYWCLLVVHALVRRGQEAAELSGEVAHLADENAALRRLVGARGPLEVPRELPRMAGLSVDRPAPRVLERGPAPAVPRLRMPEPPKGASAKDEPASRPGEPVKTKPMAAPGPLAQKAPAPRQPAAAGAATAMPTKAKAAPGGPVGARPVPPVLPARPRPHGLAALAAEKPATPPLASDTPREAVPAETLAVAEVADPRAQDIAIMQSLIKGLADQINGPPVKAESARAPLVPEVAGPAEAVETQVAALRDMADDMRESLSVPAAGRVGVPQELREVLAEAVASARIDLCLDPILGLDDRKARHYEVSVRLHGQDGEVFDPQTLSRAIAGTGLAPRIEALTFSETVRLAGEFAARGAYADLFSMASGESLRDGGFHATLNGALAPDATLGARLVMAIAQSEVRAFGPAHWEALAALADAGLRYALVDVVDLDMDFEELADSGFEFVRLDAPVFLQGLAAPHGFVPAADLCRHLSGLGFTLIVSRIGEERDLVKVLGFGALLGQGRLFGGPRTIRQDRPGRSTSAA